MKMIQQLQDILHNRVVATLLMEAKALAGAMRTNGMMDSEVGAIVERKYRELGIVINLEYSSAYVAKDLKVNIVHPYYMKKMDSAVFQFEIEISKLFEAANQQSATESEGSANQQPATENEESAS
jgi:hypothetical protein